MRESGRASEREWVRVSGRASEREWEWERESG